MCLPSHPGCHHADGIPSKINSSDSLCYLLSGNVSRWQGEERRGGLALHFSGEVLPSVLLSHHREVLGITGGQGGREWGRVWYWAYSDLWYILGLAGFRFPYYAVIYFYPYNSFNLLKGWIKRVLFVLETKWKQWEGGEGRRRRRRRRKKKKESLQSCYY